MTQEHPLRRFASSPLQGGHASGPAQPVPRHVLEERVLALENFYRLVQVERMQGIPLLNAALQVEAVGFEWSAADAEEPVAEGVLITPWFMSLVRLPAQPLPHGHRVGRSTVHAFGSERFDFIGAHDPAVGFHETCALFSPMGEFTTQALARETAREALALTRPAPVAAPAPAVREPVPARRAFFLGGRA
ncbi:[NiFe]-hydrogenase assembly chaperone HybE [Hydrogenophaga laconesensis]|uniref:[NiFe] hydrogenase assembly HybE family chaperone n=1 Tax=Hydrogenophaga laconesensis TaxID=1805971 RepID=A0ABU1VGL7_9BURK|nr:[NiFe]-hydrogenase assembly chaperone HybE [Hydrogenophaga laconesensis]MDR7096592.1 [NiFe] hydrogenase assembly HybE family chaperone [Hydrogenophaga laconesensis]